MFGEQPCPGPPCTITAGLPEGFPQVSQCTWLPSPPVFGADHSADRGAGSPAFGADQSADDKGGAELLGTRDSGGQPVAGERIRGRWRLALVGLHQ